ADALIRIAHPDFREDLTKQAYAMGLRLNKLGSLPKTPETFYKNVKVWD
ncbi:hypothetical protein HYR69_04060, partial [Candidatus Sumerlaeota bacterium]|nr:hypothetical protein [Candidatus Sumerlaeota bacterium]